MLCGWSLYLRGTQLPVWVETLFAHQNHPGCPQNPGTSAAVSKALQKIPVNQYILEQNALTWSSCQFFIYLKKYQTTQSSCFVKFLIRSRESSLFHLSLPLNVTCNSDPGVVLSQEWEIYILDTGGRKEEREERREGRRGAGGRGDLFAHILW